MTATTELCPHCDVAAIVVRETRSVSLGQRRVEIEDEFMRCPVCSEQFYTSDQADARHRRAIEKARSEDTLLSPTQIIQIRNDLGLTQRQFEQLLGVGEKTCIRWEHGRVCQNKSTDRLIRLLAGNRDNVALLAATNGVAVPDSCFVPYRVSGVPLNAGAPDAYGAQDYLAENDPMLIRLAGNKEPESFGTGEYPAILAGALGDVETFPVHQASWADHPLSRNGGSYARNRS